jgi:hypothetical protein
MLKDSNPKLPDWPINDDVLTVEAADVFICTQ